MLNFIYGRSGSGKTEKIIEMIKERVAQKKRTYLLVPEQQAFISESMLSILPPSSALCFEVVSFSRLCNIVFSKFGGLTDPVSNMGERDLIMWQALRELTQKDGGRKGDLLKEYELVKSDPTFSSMMLSTIDELHANGITAEECEAAAEACSDTHLSNKLRDVSLIYANYARILSDRLGEDAIAGENRLVRLKELIRSNRDFFKDCHIFVDSFTSFTAEERNLLFELARSSAEFTITFCRDEESRGMPHSVSIDKTYKDFKGFAEENGLDVTSIPLKADPEKRDEALALLEKNLWNFSFRQRIEDALPEEKLSHIEAYKCKNEFEEITMIALKILEEQKKGVSFSNMAVIFRDVESRKGLLESVFSKMGIPYFLSERTDISATSAARLVFSALRCVIYNFRTVDVLTLLKTGLCNISDEESDLFEDYVYTWSINGAKFLEDRWSMNPGGYTTDEIRGRASDILNAANRVRARLIPPLVTLRDALYASGGNVTSSCRALYNYLTDISLADSLSRLAALDLSLGDVRSAGEDLRIYDCIITALSRIAAIFDKKQNDSGRDLLPVKMTAEELLSAVEIMLRGGDVGSVPAVGEYVTVGSAPTLRVENVKIAFVPGLCEGEFPKNYSDVGVFTEKDKEIMASLKNPIALTSRENSIVSDELFYVYRAMTKPQDKLILSTCSARVGGGSCTPSMAWNRILTVFPKLVPFSFDLELIKGLAEECKNTETGDELLPTEDEVIINPLIIENLFGNKLVLSKSKITAYESCPYQYFSRYALNLRERRVSAISYDNSGTVVHYALEHLIKDLMADAEKASADGEENKENRSSLPIIDDVELAKRIGSYVDKYAKEIGCDLDPATTYTFSRLRDLSLVMAKDVLGEFADSAFNVLSTEMKISSITDEELEGKPPREGELRPIVIKIESGGKERSIVLNGIIDRIDYYDKDGSRYIRVVDYKSGNHIFDSEEMKNGKDVQLPVYLFTAALDQNNGASESGCEVRAASALFHSAKEEKGEVTLSRSGFMLSDPDLFRATSASLNKKILMGIEVDAVSGEATKGNAYSQTELDEIETNLNDSVIKVAQNIYAGHAERKPSSDSCKYCFLRESCPVAAKKIGF